METPVCGSIRLLFSQPRRDTALHAAAFLQCYPVFGIAGGSFCIGHFGICRTKGGRCCHPRTDRRMARPSGPPAPTATTRTSRGSTRGSHSPCPSRRPGSPSSDRERTPTHGRNVPRIHALFSRSSSECNRSMQPRRSRASFVSPAWCETPASPGKRLYVS